MQHNAPSWIYLLIIPLVIFVRLRRARQAAQASDLWFEPEGDHFIYHPFGRFGGAFLVAPTARDAIRARLAVFVRAAGLLLLVVALGPMLLAAADPDTFQRLRPQIWPVRLAIVGLVLLGSLAWRRFALRPLYAGAPAAPRRIAAGAVRARRAAARSWWAVCLSLAFLLVVALSILWSAYKTERAVVALYAVPVGILLMLNLRTAAAKWRLRWGK